jgi:DNA-binding GntR family transcriptional regulator
MNRDPALSRADREHRQLLRLCRDGKVAQACEYLAAHIEKVRHDLHALLERGARPGRTRPHAIDPTHARTAV